MWSRRRFLEGLAASPMFARLRFDSRVPADTGAIGVATNGKGRRDYFRELGVRPFINAAGTYTAMTASLMPPEVMDAINYASKQYVMLDELHDRVGERIAKLVHAEAAMVTSGAASALTLGTAGVLTGTDRQKIGANILWPSFQQELLRQGVSEGRDTVIPAEFCRRADMSITDALNKP